MVDTTAPTVSLTAPEDGTLVRGEITLSANVSDANGVRNVLFLIDGEVFDSDMSDPYEPTWDSSTLPDGEHTITVRAYDEAGNMATSETRAIRVDNTAPDTIVRRSPDDLTSGRTASFEFSSPDDGNATFECSLDGEAFVPCESRRQYQDLPDGEHVFRVRAVDAAGNRDPSPAERRFVIDAGAPGAPVILSPAQSSTDNDGNFSISGSAEPGSTVGLYDGEELVGRAAVDEAGNWSVDLRDVSLGAHTYHATATDDAGNVSGRSGAVVVTVERPVDRTVDTVITGGPSGTVDTDKVTFGFESNVEGATFECSLDDGPFAPCDPTTVFSVSEGPHIFQVRAVAAGDNVDQTPASRAFTVDLPDEPPLSDPPVVRDDGGSTGEAAAVSNAFISQYASSRARTPTGLYQFDTSESSYRLNQVGAKIAGPVNAIGYRSTDQSLYGYRLTGTPGIVRIDPKTGAVLEDLGIPQGLPAKSYFAGDVSPDGSTYYLYANRTGVLWVVDLGTFTASSVRLSSPIDVADFAVSPNDGNLYSVATNGRLVQVDPRTGRVTARALAGLKPGLYGATWFTAQGDLIAYQNAVSRTRGVMIWIADPTTTPRVVSKQAGPRTYGNDGAAYVASPDPAGLSLVVDVLANDGDPAGSLDPSTLQIQIVQPSHGTATVNEVDKTIMYTSDSTYSGTDSFTYKVCAADAPERCSSSATVNITSAPIQSSAAAPNG